MLIRKHPVPPLLILLMLLNSSRSPTLRTKINANDVKDALENKADKEMVARETELNQRVVLKLTPSQVL